MRKNVACWNGDLLQILQQVRLRTLLLLLLPVLLTIPMAAFAGAYTQTVTLSERNASLITVFRKIEKQTGYHFWYEDALLKQTRPVTVSFRNAPLPAVLDACLKDQPLTYTIVERTVVIKRRPVTPAALVTTVAAPDEIVTGRVLNERSEPVVGATVQVKGTGEATSTNEEGRFRISVPSTDAVLVISSVGYAPQEVALGGRTAVEVSLTGNAQNMSEVVVTALGIRREARRLGYSTATVNTEQLTTNRTVNVGNSLQGKVAGLNVTPPAGGPGSSSKIRLRGQSSFGPNNSPLIVVNGIPFNNQSYAAGTGGTVSNTPAGGSSDQGDGLQSINPEDIESMTVLKGGAAAALYGSRAKDGVIIITTKSGRGMNGIGVELNSNFQAEQALDFIDFQYEYGQGEFGKRPATLSEAQSSGVWSFGERFDGKPQIQFDGTTRPYEPHKNRIRDFYRTGYAWTNSVALSGGSDKGNFRLSFANTTAEAIMPNSDFNKKILNLGLSYRFTNKFSVQLNANYSNEHNQNPPQIGIQDMNANTTVYTLANSIHADWLKNYKDAQGNEMALARFTNRNNPYWVTYNRFENVRRDRIFGNASLRYEFTKNFYLQGRIGQDYFSRPYDYNRPTGTRSIGSAPPGLFNGVYYQDVSTFRERNMDLMAGYSTTFGDFGIDLMAGGNSMQQQSDRMRTLVTNFYVRDLYTIGNGVTKEPEYDFGKLRINSLYGSAEFSLRNFLYLTLTARNDWFSTLNPQSNSYLYPSASGSFVFSQAARMPAWLNFGKLRLAYAEVGSGTDPYSDKLYYAVNANALNGIPLGRINSSVSPNPNLRPLKIKEAEAGLELRLFNRVLLDVSVYRKNTVDEILNVDISNASGFGQTKVNIGKLRNEGVEMLLSVNPVKGRLNWETALNGSFNESTVLQLAEGQQRFDVGNGEFFGIVSHEVGRSLASLRGFDYRRDAKGNILTVNGKFQQGSLVTFGSAIPKWVGGWLNTLSFDRFRLFTQVDFKAGHKILSNSNLNFLRHGLHKRSLEGRQGGVVFPGVNPDGSPNTVAVEAEDFYATYRGANNATAFVYKGDFIRWRALSLGYDFSNLVKGTFMRGLNVSLIMNNVLMIKKHIDNLDPEASVSSSDFLQGIETHALPTTRSYGLNVNIKL
ncbi:MAG TPA: SusC/RagA family TonB-linked outer membrane protein [Chitinophagaceae bacterium]|jgi:TonB-linked SusC/RagA family outer membrane protein|nr:SusC/RagA family TonB-linked outer membrane protein [Chitinophagaceae bacterium]